MQPKINKNIIALIIVAALGYFVDIYDLLLFLIIKNKSLTAIGVPADKISEIGIQLLNWQMGGLLIGGFFWGILGDKKGRLSVLFGSILLYSLANLANAFVHNIPTYAALRFVAGFGLAGELGAGITLVAESMSKEKRGYGTMIVASIGILGAVGAYYVNQWFNWRIAFGVGAGLGLTLLILRISVFESNIFTAMKDKAVEKGNFAMILLSWTKLKKYIFCTLVAVPLWFVVGILVNLAADFGKALHASETLNSSKGVMITYIGIAIGDFLSGMLSQILKSRKKVVLLFQILSLGTMLLYLLRSGWTPNEFYVLCFFFGVCTGYWVLFVTISTESFGTNLRATVTTSTPNVVRGSLILVSMLFSTLREQLGIVHSGIIIAIGISAIAIFSLLQLKETFGKDLNYFER